jgi:2-dehydro-3-deoxyphosphogluconate aldolase / (4S)-4-hydroxy-2-oxoglutarate aldolase
VDTKQNLTTVLRDGFILVFNMDKLDIVKTAQALLDAGVKNMEVTCRIKKPLEKMERLRKELPDFVMGAASLVDNAEMLKIFNKSHPNDQLPSVQQVADAGAMYLVSAINFSDATYGRYGRKLPIIPGCGTATEIVTQFSKGASLCKIFPAKELGGPAFVKAVDPAIHKTIALVPTGGTTCQNIPDYASGGIFVYGGSFSMIEKATLAKITDEQDYKLLAAELKKIKALIDETRAKVWPNLNWQTASLEEISKATGRYFNID